MRMKRKSAGAAALVLFVAFSLSAASAGGITRDRVMAKAKAFAFHFWRCTTANQTASCSASYTSPYPIGDYQGLAYDWGGYMSIFEFDQQIEEGYGAGSMIGELLSCTSGLDCSGYVCQCWEAAQLGTWGIPDVSTEIDASAVLAGDVFNDPGYHVVLYSHTLPSGEPVFYESNGMVHLNVYGGWGSVAGFVPLRYNNIEGSSAGEPMGTFTNPIIIDHFPFVDSGRDTTNSPSDVVDGCGAVPSTDESGPEYVYQVTFTQPGSLTVSVEDGPGVDIDIHLYTSNNTSDCVERNDSVFTYNVDCGTYFIVADTYISYAGPYTLNVDFAPSGGACGSGPPGYHPLGGPGEPCAYPGHEDLPDCDPYMGAYDCLYSDSPAFSFCSRPCATMSECLDFPDGCCFDIGGGEYYCFTADLCAASPPDEPVIPDTATDAEDIIGPDIPDIVPDPFDDTVIDDVVIPDDVDVIYDMPVDEQPVDTGTDDDVIPEDGNGGGCSC